MKEKGNIIFTEVVITSDSFFFKELIKYIQDCPIPNANRVTNIVCVVKKILYLPNSCGFNYPYDYIYKNKPKRSYDIKYCRL